MPYTPAPDQRLPYDVDGSIVVQDIDTHTPAHFASSSDMQGWQSAAGAAPNTGYTNVNSPISTWICFPQLTVVTGIYGYADGRAYGGAFDEVTGSADSTNGLDGTWETATLSGGFPAPPGYTDLWRSGIKPVSFSGPMKWVKVRFQNPGTPGYLVQLHVYGHKASGEVPDDLIAIDSDEGSSEFTGPEDFGDVHEASTPITRSFKIRNTSATLTANSVLVEVDLGSHWKISLDGATWVTSLTLPSSIAPGADSPTIYIQDIPPSFTAPLGPDEGRVVWQAGSWS